LRAFENRVLRGIFGPKREEVAGHMMRSFLSFTLDLINIKYAVKWRKTK
jgi:hypothetical protein